MKVLKQFVDSDSIHDYVIFKISECTEKSLEEKCNFILKHQALDWKPLRLEYAENLKVFTMVYYYEK